MATQLGNLTINTVNGNTITGVFESVYEGNVGHGSRSTATRIIIEAWLFFNDEDETDNKWATLIKENMRGDSTGLYPYIQQCLFETPRCRSTKFTLTVNDAALLAGVEPATIETYYLG